MSWVSCSYQSNTYFLEIVFKFTEWFMRCFGNGHTQEQTKAKTWSSKFAFLAEDKNTTAPSTEDNQ